MKIEYIYIKEYLNIVNQEFNFTNSFVIKNNKDFLELKSLKKISNENDSKINITAIVGENGTGKTTILNAMTYILSGNASFEFIIVFCEGEELFIYSNIQGIKINKERSLKTTKLSQKAYSELDVSSILYSNVKTKTTWYLNEKVSLLTETYLSKCSKYDCDYHYGEEISEIDAHELNDISRQISYISYVPEDFLGVSTPDELSFHISTSFEDIYSGKHKPDYLVLFKFKEVLEKYHSLIITEKFIGKFYITFILNFFQELFSAIRHSPYAKLEKENIERINSLIINENKGLKYFSEIIEKLCKLNYLRSIFKDHIYYNEKELSKIQSSFKNKMKLIRFLDSNNNDMFYIKTSEKVNLRKIIKLYSESIYKYQYCTMKWEGLSSGENAKLNIYSRIYERIHNRLKTLSKDFKTSKNLILMMDEGATFFHPEWQRSFIYDITRFINNVIAKNSNIERFQLILTSHSPFVISDLTRDQVIYLNKIRLKNSNYNYCNVVSHDRKPYSFAANISSLYRNSFFLTDTLTGKYSTEILNEIINSLIDKKSIIDIDKLNYIISEISDPILKNHISKLLAEHNKEI